MKIVPAPFGRLFPLIMKIAIIPNMIARMDAIINIVPPVLIILTTVSKSSAPLLENSLRNSSLFRRKNISPPKAITSPYDKIPKIAESIQLDYATTVTINEHVAEKIDRISRYGISKRLFFGYLICDYFYRYYHYFITKDEIDEEKEVNTERDYLQIKLDKTVKDKIVEYCEKQYISINSLFSYYILNKEITVKSFHIKEPELLYLTLGKNVKDMIRKKAIEMNVSYRFFLNLVAAQICQDLSL